MRRRRYVLILLLTFCGCVGCDQVTEYAAKDYLPRGEAMSWFGDTVRLVYAENPGAFLSLGASWPEHVRMSLFTIGSSGIVIAVFVALFTIPRLSLSTAFGLALLGGGGAGNLIDRIAYGGHVIDFMNVGIGALRTGIFNLADTAILLGAVLVMVSSMERKRKPDR